MATLLLSGAAVIPDGSFGAVPDSSDILIEGDRIAAIEPAGRIAQADRRIDAGALVAASGLINGHLHSWDHFIKGRVENLPMEMMMAHLRPAVPLRLTERDVYLRNASIGSGAADLRALRDAGINVSMGSDGCGVTFTCSMLQTLKFGAGIGRIRTTAYQDWPTAAEIWSAATTGGARALGREHELGRLAAGFKADIVLYRKSSMGLVPLNAPVRQLVHGESGSGIDTVVVDGEVVMQGGRLTKVDELKLIGEFQDAHVGLIDSIQASEAASAPLLEGLGCIYARSLSVPIASDITRGVIDPYETSEPTA